MISEKSRGFLLLLLLGGLIGGFFYWRTGWKISEPGNSLSEQLPKNPPSATLSSTVKYPVAAESNLQAGSTRSADHLRLPALDESDLSIEKSLKEWFGQLALEKIFNLQGFIRRLVITVDSAMGKRPGPANSSVFQSVDGQFQATRSGKELSLSLKNYQRYLPLVTLLNKVDAKKLGMIYTHFYPLFQAAFRDLTPQGYFNDRLIEVIDELLDAPEPSGAIGLVLESVYYKFADPLFESRSNGQKIILRIGIANELAVKVKLREIREVFVHFSR